MAFMVCSSIKTMAEFFGIGASRSGCRLAASKNAQSSARLTGDQWNSATSANTGKSQRQRNEGDFRVEVDNRAI